MAYLAPKKTNSMTVPAETLTIDECPVCASPQGPNAKYCAHCGQRHRYGRLTVGAVFSDFFRQLTNFDRGFGHNLVMIYRNPGKMFRDLIARHNGRYQNILRFTLIVTTLSVLAYQVFGLYDAQVESFQALPSDRAPNPDAIDTGKVIQEIMNKYMSLLYFLSIPFSAILNRLLYWKRPFNLAEHVVLAAIQASGGMLIVLLFDVFNFGFSDGNVGVMAAGYFIYWVYLSYCLKTAMRGSWLGALTKSTLSMILAITIISLLVGLCIPLIVQFVGWWSGQEAVDAWVDRFRYE